MPLEKQDNSAQLLCNSQVVGLEIANPSTLARESSQGLVQGSGSEENSPRRLLPNHSGGRLEKFAAKFTAICKAGRLCRRAASVRDGPIDHVSSIVHWSQSFSVFSHRQAFFWLKQTFEQNPTIYQQN